MSPGSRFGSLLKQNFRSCRRLLLSYTSNTQPTYSYAGRQLRDTPVLGSFHASEIYNVYGQSALPPTKEIQVRCLETVPECLETDRDRDQQSRWIAFANTMDRRQIPSLQPLQSSSNTARTQQPTCLGIYTGLNVRQSPILPRAPSLTLALTDGAEKSLIQFTMNGSSIIPDTYRKEAIGYWSTIFKYLAL